MPGDYVLWDTRLPHTTGACDAHNLHDKPRQVFYCAYMLTDEALGMISEHRACRETGLHPSWAPSSQRYDEMRNGFVPAPLSSLGEALYGYDVEKNNSQSSVSHRRTWRGDAQKENDADYSSSSSTTTNSTLRRVCDEDCGLTAEHISFFERYGYVVVESALAPELVRRIKRQTYDYMLHRYGLDFESPASTSQHFTLEKLQRAFSPDGSGMIELYWLHAMEEARQSPRLISIFQQLYNATWGRSVRGFSSAFCGRPPPLEPRLAIYVDRTSIRLPLSSLSHILRGEGLKIRVPIPREFSGLDEGMYYVDKILDCREVSSGTGGHEYLVRWKDWGPKHDSWEPEAHICDRTLIDAFHGRVSEWMGGAEGGGEAEEKVEEQPAEKAAVLSVGVISSADHALYLADTLVASRVSCQGHREFLVRWKGYGAKHDSWEPEGNIRDHSLITAHDQISSELGQASIQHDTASSERDARGGNCAEHGGEDWNKLKSISKE